jgi:membrane associated rhomboid family serine protease
MLLALFAVTGPGRGALGVVPARRGIRAPMWHGEPWRAVTALTLHGRRGSSSWATVVATVLLVTAVAQRLGPGVGLAIFVLAGAIANLLAAAVHGDGHVAVGTPHGHVRSARYPGRPPVREAGTVRGSRTRR